MAMRLNTEKEILSRPRRLPGIQASKIGLDTVLGLDCSIGFSDFLNGIVARTLLWAKALTSFVGN